MQHFLTRRAFIGTVVGAGVLVVPLASGANAAANALYGLSADWGAGDPTCVPDRGRQACGGCYACVRHARNKVFASAGAADRGRAHPKCRCRVVALGTVDADVYGALFAHRPSADRRTPGIAELLARRAPGRAPTRALVPPGLLPFTGMQSLPLGLGGAGAVIAGAVIWRASRRSVVAGPAPTTAPTAAPPEANHSD